MKNIFIIIILFFSANVFSQSKNDSPKEEPKQEEVFTMVEEMPQFPGGETEMMKYIRDNLKFPESAKKDSTFKGCKTIVKFVVGAEGKIKNETVVRNCINCMECDVAAIKVISSMPKWTPGKQSGRAVAVSYVLPIFFNKP